MKDVQLLVLNTHCEPAGVGELGEIFVRSPHMSAGYLGLPEATAKKFMVNPSTGEEWDRMYRSGDLGRYHANGIVECIGRADDQVKIRGFRIELGEIDTHLGQHPMVRENRTLCMRDSKEEKQIIAFFVPADAKYSISEIRKYLTTKLPSYAVPTILCPIERMPLTPNGKIDNRRLPYPDAAIILAQRQRDEADGDGSEGATVTPMERKLLQVFEEVLGRPVMVADNFFEVGGHSILATRLTFQLRQALKQELPLNLLYQFPTVRSLARAVQAGLDSAIDELASDSKSSAEVLDVEKEIVLDEAIAANGRSYKGAANVKAVFLTGATGFLGAFLLVELLRKYPEAVVRCLVRAADESAGFARLAKNLKQHHVWNDAYAPRIIAVVGDLAKRYFGLPADKFQAVAEQTDLVIHNGAVVHWVCVRLD
jgi:L-aminoadipate-semialdehyde dehydrogenase